AGSLLRLKNGSAQDDSLRVIAKLHHYRFLASMLYRAFPSLCRGEAGMLRLRLSFAFAKLNPRSA
ncbi:MAG: hypothetical protein WCC89_22835, partial [Candidatus Sulfotelmatobacter sp.]